MDSLIAPESLSAETAKGDNHGIKGNLLNEQILGDRQGIKWDRNFKE